MSAKSEKTITQEDVRNEHLKEVHPMAHWAYLFGVLAVATMVMIVMIAVLAGATP